MNSLKRLNPENLTGTGFGTRIGIRGIQNITENNYFGDDNRYQRSVMTDNTTYFDLGNGQGLINSVSYLPLLIDNLYYFGQFVACMSLNELYASGFTPISASIIAGWPEEGFSHEDAKTLAQGANEVCERVGIKITGGYKVKSDKLFYGLSVNGTVELKEVENNIKKLSTNNDLYLTKPLGIETAVMATSESEYTDENSLLYKHTTQPETIGAKLAYKSYVHGMKKLDSNGLLGSLALVGRVHDMCFEVDSNMLPMVDNYKEYIRDEILPIETLNIWHQYSQYTNVKDEELAKIVSAPSNCGGILMAIDRNHTDEFISFCKENNTEVFKIGRIKETEKKNLFVELI
ncbi:MAG: selenide, water dikinase SelD [Marinifilaceae bacterium]|jgi:selenide,water dikinase|nr:selenide, water dikinase SelD [Marinifilaceae bacterium]